MVKLRLSRMGATKQPSYRIVAIDSRNARNGAFLSILGHYNPRTQPETVSINETEALKWLKDGAQPSATVARLLTKAGIMEKFKPGKEKA